jgi:hypothetical protein
MGLGFGRDHEAEVPRREAGPTPAGAGGKSIDQRKPPGPPQAPSPFELTSAQNRPATDGPSAEAVACSPMRADSYEGANLDGNIQARPACLFCYLGEGAMTTSFYCSPSEAVSARRGTSAPISRSRRAEAWLCASFVTLGRRVGSRLAAAVG